jgi:hypothetical protein
MEPVQLRRGKEFQKIVQEDYGKTSIDGKSKIEEYISFEKLPTVKQKYGRIDILIDYKKEDDYIMIM